MLTKHLLAIPVLVALLGMNAGPIAAQDTRSGSDDGIGFPSPAAALAALKARPEVTFSDYDGWTIAEDAGRHEIWSFTPENHPAHPSVVRRTIQEQDSPISIQMGVMCGASKAVCDTLVSQFQQLNKQLQAQLTGSSASSDKPAVDALMARNAEAVLAGFLAAIDENRIADAYSMFNAGFKAQVTKNQFEEVMARTPARPVTRGTARTTWYQDPPQAPEPGSYAVFELPCRLSDGNACLDMVVLHQPPGGKFAIQRYERTFVSSEKP